MELTVKRPGNLPNEVMTLPAKCTMSMWYGSFGVRLDEKRRGFAITSSGGAEFVRIEPVENRSDLFRVILDPFNVPHIDVSKKAATAVKEQQRTEKGAAPPKPKATKEATDAPHKEKKRKHSADAVDDTQGAKKKRKIKDKADAAPVHEGDVFALFNVTGNSDKNDIPGQHETSEARVKREEKNRKRRERDAAKRAEKARLQEAEDARGTRSVMPNEKTSQDTAADAAIARAMAKSISVSSSSSSSDDML